MATRINPKHDEATRQKIQTSQLVNRLNSIALGEITVDSIQLRAIEVALKKTLPDLQGIELTGPDGGSLKQDVTISIVRPR